MSENKGGFDAETSKQWFGPDGAGEQDVIYLGENDIDKRTQSEYTRQGDRLTKGITDAIAYAEGGNPEGVNYFDEMDDDPEFMKGLSEFEAKTKRRLKSQGKPVDDQDLLVAEMFNLMNVGDETYYSAGDSSYFNEDGIVSQDLLRKAGRSEGPRLIKAHRRLQFIEFVRYSDGTSPGFRIRHKDPEHKTTAKERDEMKRWSEIMVNGFFNIWNNEKQSLYEVLSAAYTDWFDLDKLAFLIRRKRNGDVLGMTYVDPAVLFHITPKRTLPQRYDNAEFKQDMKDAFGENVIRDNPYFKEPWRYIMVVAGQPRVKYKPTEMILSHCFRQSDRHEAWKGTGVIEQAIRIVTALVNSLTMNASRMTNNRAPYGILALQGGANVSQLAVEKFKKLLWAQTMGAHNRWRIPIIGLPEKNEIQWIPFHQNSRDMEFFDWMSLLFTIICRLSGTDPEELSLASNKAAMTKKNTLFEENTSDIVKRSKDAGLRLFLEYFVSIINTNGIIYELTGHEDWEWAVSGLETDDQMKREELNQMQMKSTMSLNDILVKADLPRFTAEIEVDGEKINMYDIPGVNNDAVQLYLQHKISQADMELQMKMQLEMAKFQEEQAAMMGGEEEMGEEEFSEADQRLVEEYGEPAPA